MEIQKDNQGKWIRPQYGNYLTQNSATEDKDKVLVLQVYVPNEESNDEWVEITSEEADRIIKAKRAAQGSISYPEAAVNQMIGLFASQINNMEISDSDSLKFKGLYPNWEEFIGKSLKANFKINYLDKLYKTLQEVSTVLDQQGYRPGEFGSEALYTEINEPESGGHQGTLEDPIPYNNNMELFEGKYYSHDGVVYKCIRNTEQPVYQDLSGLVGIYVETAV